MCTFAPAKVAVALANCYQRTEKEQFRFRKGGMRLFLLYVCIWERVGKTALEMREQLFIYNIIIKF